MVQILVHVRPADRGAGKHFELLECAVTTTIRQIKEQVYQLGRSSGRYDVPYELQELKFMDEICQDEKSLADFGICEDFISQVTGFVIDKAS